MSMPAAPPATFEQLQDEALAAGVPAKNVTMAVDCDDLRDMVARVAMSSPLDPAIRDDGNDQFDACLELSTGEAQADYQAPPHLCNSAMRAPASCQADQVDYRLSSW